MSLDTQHGGRPLTSERVTIKNRRGQWPGTTRIALEPSSDVSLGATPTRHNSKPAPALACSLIHCDQAPAPHDHHHLLHVPSQKPRARASMTFIQPPMSPTEDDSVSSPWTRDGTYIIENTRRAHACCRSCDATIQTNRLRVGVVYQHMNGFVCINWHHLECYPHVHAIPLDKFEGYRELEPIHQKLVLRCQLSTTDEATANFQRASSACSV